MAAHHYLKEFRAVVLKHMQEEIDPHEWNTLRAMAANGANWVPGKGYTHDPLATPESLARSAINFEDTSVEAICRPEDTLAEAGLIDGLPVYYFSGRGIYMFGEVFDSDEALSLWITTPAWPPGW